MPELPEVSKMVSEIRSHIGGRILLSIENLRTRPRSDILGYPERLTAGMAVRKLNRHGKVILLSVGDMLMTFQLGMSGRLVLRKPDRRHDRFALHFDGGVTLTFTDHRGFGRVHAVVSAKAWSLSPLKDQGPDALSGPLSPDTLRQSRRSIKTALLDQSVIAGLGNIYVCESLYRAAIDPHRSCSSLSDVEASRLTRIIPELLQDALASGGTTLEDYRGTEGEAGTFERKLAVYGRTGQPCPNCHCLTGIQRTVQQGRSTWYCPTLQR